MAYISGDQLRNFYARNTLNNPKGTTIPLSNDAMRRVLNPTTVPTSQNGIGINTQRAMQDAVGVPKTFNVGNTVKNTAKAAAPTAAESIIEKAATAGTGSWWDNLKTGASNTWNNVKSGKGIMPEYAKYANIAAGINAAATAAQGISQYSNAVADTEDLVSQILASAGGNPNLRYDLSADQMQLLRRLQNGTYDTSAGFGIDGLLNNLGNVATGAGLGFLTGGGWTGALMGALAPAAEGITSGMSADQGRITAELEGLYNALLDSEMTTKEMKRNANMQRYANSIYGY